MVRSYSTPPPRRSGVILLIVVVMLALFMVVGLSFMLYAESEASASRIYREAFTVNYDRADIDPGTLLQWALGQLVYDVSDYGDGVYSALRGHSLARNMYGWNNQINPGTLSFVQAASNNTVAFNGYGKLPPSLDPSPLGATVDNRQLLNYTFFPNYTNPGQSFLRDPERVGVRQTGGNPLDLPFMPITANFSGGWNPPYTYPDLNNVFLAALRASDPAAGNGPNVMLPSFHRAPPGTPFYVQNLNHNQLSNPNPWLDTTDPTLKYRVLRPRPADMYWGGPNDPHSFPLPASDTGDVQNLTGGFGNDSIWMDLGYPVQTTRGGTKFKPLFAFLVVDLDSRVNVNVHGNVRGPNNKHVSDQGVGKDEVSLEQVLTASPPNVSEAAYILSGNSTVGLSGRYGADVGVVGRPGGLTPLSGPPATPENYPVPQDTVNFTMRPYMTRVDYDGTDDNGNPTTRFALSSQYKTQPDYNPGGPGAPSGYDSLMFTTPTALQNQPLLYNVLNAGRQVGNNVNDDKPFSINDNLFYLIGAASGPNYQRSALYQLGVKNNLDQAAIRLKLTTHSFDLETAGARPWITDPTTAPYQLTQPNPGDTADKYQPRGMQGFQLTTEPAKNGVPLTNNNWHNPIPAAWKPGTTDFVLGDGRTFVLPRLDLNRKLASYYDQGGFMKTWVNGAPNPPPSNSLNRVYWERQKFAEEIFDRLVQATGASPSAAPGSPEYNARRYLAQLAVNIVDYVDDDEFSTPFQWDLPAHPNEFVYGVEAPKLVLNEIYAEIRNDPADDGQPFATRDFRLHFWIELFNMRNPSKLPNPAYDTDRNTNNDNRAMVHLKSAGGDPAYRIQIYDKTALPPNAMRELSNTDGVPRATPGGKPTPPKLQLQDWSASDPSFTPTIPPAELVKVHPFDPLDPNYPNGLAGQNVDGYYVVASNTDIVDVPPVQPTNRVPQAPATGLRYDVTLVTEAQWTPPPNHTVILQRLLCPMLPPNPPDPGTGVDPTRPYNPYVTVDYVDTVPTWDAVKVVKPPVPLVPAPHSGGTPLAKRASVARAQPAAAMTNVPPTTPPDSFFKVNSTSAQFDWLIHLDRPPISPMELLHVSGFKPQEVTQTFVDAGQSFRHVASWTDDQTRLYRALEFFTVGDRSNWSSYIPSPPNPPPTPPSSGGRKPGMINVNTVWDQEILNALTDPQPANFFTTTETGNAWKNLQGRRPMVTSNSGTDAPYMSFANPGPQQPGPPVPVGEFPTQSGFAGTFVHGDFAGAQTPASPYVSQEMLRKIANTMTTRSNVFAVYLTVGFFEVMDDTVRPVRLGAEIRARNGVPIRHRMFSIVDRTNLGIVVPIAGSGPTAGLEQGGTDVNPTNNTAVLKTQFFVTSEDGVYQEQLGQTATLNIVGGIANPFMYDGKTITIPPPNPPATGFTMYADVGTQQEVLQNCTIVNGQLRVPNFTKTHAPGFTLSYLRPGNPGPQGPIDFTNPRYTQVIPYAAIIQ